jgi:hypothetical protein
MLRVSIIVMALPYAGAVSVIVRPGDVRLLLKKEMAARSGEMHVTPKLISSNVTCIRQGKIIIVWLWRRILGLEYLK